MSKKEFMFRAEAKIVAESEDDAQIEIINLMDKHDILWEEEEIHFKRRNKMARVRDYDAEEDFNDYLEELFEGNHQKSIRDILEQLIRNYWDCLPKWILKKLEDQ